MKRAFVIVIDSLGIGALPDAHLYHDEGANTTLHIWNAVPNPRLPTLNKLGLFKAMGLVEKCLVDSPGAEAPIASFGAMIEKSPGKDTSTGHWELAGIILDKPFRTFPPQYPSFPNTLTDAFCRETGTPILGNKAASGTAIIEELGAQHVNTTFPIVYTSADSVFQIAAHESIIPLDKLYAYCEIARKLCNEYNIARVIARPFLGAAPNFSRTKNRKDFSLPLPETSLLDHLKTYNVETVGVGKIGNIFDEQGLTQNFPEKGNQKCLARTHALLQQPVDKPIFIFVNLVDTDMLFGHRRDPLGYYQALVEIDQHLEKMIPQMKTDDLLVITADHGCDPTFQGSDHTREYVPVLVYQPNAAGKNLGIRKTFADLSQSIADFFQVKPMKQGNSFFS